jgi:hypothetical protein
LRLLHLLAGLRSPARVSHAWLLWIAPTLVHRLLALLVCNRVCLRWNIPLRSYLRLDHRLLAQLVDWLLLRLRVFDLRVVEWLWIPLVIGLLLLRRCAPWLKWLTPVVLLNRVSLRSHRVLRVCANHSDWLGLALHDDHWLDWLSNRTQNLLARLNIHGHQVLLN